MGTRKQRQRQEELWYRRDLAEAPGHPFYQQLNEVLDPNEIIELAKEVKTHLKGAIKEYPDEVLNGITQAAHAVDKSRNQFSESHFGKEAGLWLATYVRDLVNTQVRLLLHFL